MVESYKVQRGTVFMLDTGDARGVIWRCADNSGEFVATGVAGSRAYAITDGCIALIKAGAAPF